MSVEGAVVGLGMLLAVGVGVAACRVLRAMSRPPSPSGRGVLRMVDPDTFPPDDDEGG